MGETLSKTLLKSDASIPEDFTDDCLAGVFSHVGKKDLLNVMLTCHRFLGVVNTSSFYLKFCQAHGYSLPPVEWRKFANLQNRPFDYRRICDGFDPYGCICPEDFFVGRLSAWELNCGTEDTSNITNDFGPFNRICFRATRKWPSSKVRYMFCKFATSCDEGARTYEIDLVGLGIEEWVLDFVRPRIIIEEWTAPRVDCAAEYSLTATLPKECRVCNEDLQPGRHRSQLSRKYVQWDPLLGFERNELVLENYSSGVRMLVIQSASRDTQGWAGNYGCKFAGLTIRFELPSKLEFVDGELSDSECGHSLSSESSYPPCEHDNYFPSQEEESDADVDPDPDAFLPDPMNPIQRFRRFMQGLNRGGDAGPASA